PSPVLSLGVGSKTVVGAWLSVLPPIVPTVVEPSILAHASPCWVSICIIGWISHNVPRVLPICSGCSGSIIGNYARRLLTLGSRGMAIRPFLLIEFCAIMFL